MKDLKDLIKVNEANSEEIIKNTVWSTDSKGIKDPDIFIINIEDKIIEFATIEEVKKDKDFFGEATGKVLSLKPMESFEDSVNIYVKLK